MKYPSLFESMQLGAVEIPNRILMAPLTRSRASEGHIPNDMMAEYYSQRASGGLLIAEATMVNDLERPAYHHPPGTGGRGHVSAPPVKARGDKMAPNISSIFYGFENSATLRTVFFSWRGQRYSI